MPISCTTLQAHNSPLVLLSAKNVQEQNSIAALYPHEADPSSFKQAAAWQRCCLLSPLGTTFGLHAQLSDLEGRIQATGNTVLAICGSAGMVRADCTP